MVGGLVDLAEFAISIFDKKGDFVDSLGSDVPVGARFACQVLDCGAV